MHEWRVCSSDRGAEMCDRSPHLTRSPREGSKPHSSMRYLTVFLWPWTTALWRQFWPKLSRSNLLSPKRFTRYFTDDSLPLIAAKWRALSRSCVGGIEPSYHWWWRWWHVHVRIQWWWWQCWQWWWRRQWWWCMIQCTHWLPVKHISMIYLHQGVK